MVQPIKVYGEAKTPNPFKVIHVLEELNVPWELHYVAMSTVGGEEYQKLNPNGRIPTIEDPNTGIILWESGAIIEYLIDTYDTNHELSYVDSPNKWLTKQYLYLQSSGQGPYFGQAAWFSFFHSEKLPSATERYIGHVKRLLGVLDLALSRNVSGWLVDSKCTYADISFVAWNTIALAMFGDEVKEYAATLPHFTKWHEALTARPAGCYCQEGEASGRACLSSYKLRPNM